MVNISIVIPLYNKEFSICKTIEAVLAQTYTHFEIIIVNDGSTDNSYEVAKEFKDERIKIISKENGGVSSARNLGIKMAQYDHIAFLDADDYWDRNYLSEMSIAINKFPSALLYYCPHEYIDKKGIGHSTMIKSLEEKYMGLISIFNYSQEEGPWTSATIIKKTKESQLFLFDEDFTMGEDIDLWIRIALKGEVVIVNKAMSHYNLNAENRLMTKPTEESKCLIMNLGKYRKIELTTPDFKRYLDKMRMSHIKNYLIGNTQEVREIDTFLAEIDLNDFGVFWRIIRFLPDSMRGVFFRMSLYSNILLHRIFFIKEK